MHVPGKSVAVAAEVVRQMSQKASERVGLVQGLEALREHPAYVSARKSRVGIRTKWFAASGVVISGIESKAWQDE